MYKILGIFIILLIFLLSLNLDCFLYEYKNSFFGKISEKFHRMFLSLNKDLIKEKIGNEKYILLSFSKESYSTCPKNAPSEYCSKDNFLLKYIILTENNIKYEITEHFIGLNFERPCDIYNFTMEEIL